VDFNIISKRKHGLETHFKRGKEVDIEVMLKVISKKEGASLGMEDQLMHPAKQQSA